MNTIKVCSTLGSATSTSRMLHHPAHGNLCLPPHLSARQRTFQPFVITCSASMEKSIKIVLVRDVDGATFWGALDEAVAPRLKAANAGAAGQEALDAFGEVFRGRSLKQGTSIFLTWVQPSRLQVAVSSDSMVPESVEASIVSADLVSSLFDVYLGENPVSPSTKAAVASGVRASLYV
ncbi:hypothetical protein GOP47_0022085 [Adiantum capillus-veneris]|uniref:Chalcone-flavonone isomerase family protein n=1 Tax=Adiantum capillus-veneris TaxID=13818 RepID=A0A9D4U8Q3_ADICA|nr:hypothetical protein GOP47_0022085 [Adiantum capillus-veneris]